MKLSVRVTPNAKRDLIVGWKGDVLHVKVRAPAVEGKANSALVEFLAETLKVPRSSVRIVSGHTSRMKLLEIEGMNKIVLGPQRLF